MSGLLAMPLSLTLSAIVLPERLASQGVWWCLVASLLVDRRQRQRLSRRPRVQAYGCSVACGRCTIRSPKTLHRRTKSWHRCLRLLQQASVSYGCSGSSKAPKKVGGRGGGLGGARARQDGEQAGGGRGARGPCQAQPASREDADGVRRRRGRGDLLPGNEGLLTDAEHCSNSRLYKASWIQGSVVSVCRALPRPAG